jgi:hypothetical protein
MEASSAKTKSAEITASVEGMISKPTLQDLNFEPRAFR